MQQRIQTWRQMSVACLTVAFLAGCGSYVPELEPGEPHATAFLVNRVVNHVKCELREAVLKALKYDLDNAANQPGHQRRLPWLEDWGALISLTLIVDEKTSVSPTAQYTGPVSGFLLAGGLQGSAQATRTEKADFFLSFESFVQGLGRRPAHSAVCIQPEGFQIEGNLKFQAVLDDLTLPLFIPGNVDPRPPKTLSSEIQFVLTASSDLNPSWTIGRVALNNSGSFFSASRTRTNDVVVTLGPVEKTKGETGPTRLLENAHYQALLYSAFSTALTSQR